MNKTAIMIDDYCRFSVGIILFLTSGVLVVINAISATIWDLIDRIFVGEKGKPATGLLFKIAQWVNKKTENINKNVVCYPQDAYMVNVIIMLGIFLPLYFAFNFWYTWNNGFSYLMCYVYNLIRVGPFVMNFAYVYTLCHKEGHMKGHQLYKGSFSWILGNMFNWWIGLFYGVVPSTFAYGHSKNHHTYNNSEKDVISTGDRPRDSFFNYVRFLPRFFAYAINASTICQFWGEKKYRDCLVMFIGSLYYFSFFAIFCQFNMMFALGYVLFPFLEQCFLLAFVNWSWHAYIDDQDVDNKFVYSITLLHGNMNLLNEDYHVVHHMYPGVHWTRHPDLYEKDKQLYHENQASMFEDTHAFEHVVMVVARNYDYLASKMIDPNGIMNHEQKKELIIRRLRACNWGPYSEAEKAKAE